MFYSNQVKVKSVPTLIASALTGGCWVKLKFYSGEVEIGGSDVDGINGFPIDTQKEYDFYLEEGDAIYGWSGYNNGIVNVLYYSQPNEGGGNFSGTITLNQK